MYPNIIQFWYQACSDHIPFRLVIVYFVFCDILEVYIPLVPLFYQVSWSIFTVSSLHLGFYNSYCILKRKTMKDSFDFLLIFIRIFAVKLSILYPVLYNLFCLPNMYTLSDVLIKTSSSKCTSAFFFFFFYYKWQHPHPDPG